MFNRWFRKLNSQSCSEVDRAEQDVSQGSEELCGNWRVGGGSVSCSSFAHLHPLPPWGQRNVSKAPSVWQVRNQQEIRPFYNKNQNHRSQQTSGTFIYPMRDGASCPESSWTAPLTSQTEILSKSLTNISEKWSNTDESVAEYSTYLWLKGEYSLENIQKKLLLQITAVVKRCHSWKSWQWHQYFQYHL